ncbi:MAG: tetratricopeptide repeat protein [Phycisphaerales bacterium]|nr:tetratricopeptide repeat protein [Phycisphaerales bacterium]
MTISTMFKVLTLGCAAAALSLSGCATHTAGEQARIDANTRLNTNKAELGAQQARQDFEVGNLKNALFNINGAIELSPDNPSYHIMQGRILIEMNHLDPAMQALRQATTLDPNGGDAHYYAGLIYQRWSDLANAVEEYQAALRTNPTNADYMLASLETLISMRRLDEAEALIESSRPHFENNAAVRRSQGHLAMLRDQPVLAAEHFQKALLLNPDDKSIIEVLILAYMKAGNFAKAEYYLDQLFRESEFAQRPDLRHLKALCLAANDRLVEARSVYLKLVDDDPSDPQIWFELGSVAFKLGDMRRVQNVVSRTMAVWPNRFESYMLRGMVLEHENRLDEAITNYQKACSLRPQHEEPYLLLGLALQAKGLDAEAGKAFQMARMVAPKSERAQSLVTLAGVETDANLDESPNR